MNRATVEIEDIHDGSANLTVNGTRVTMKYSFTGDELIFEWADKPVVRAYGEAECYSCGKSFKWSHTPGAIPTCDRCIRMSAGD